MLQHVQLRGDESRGMKQVFTEAEFFQARLALGFFKGDYMVQHTCGLRA